ncbi:MAG: bifunctional alpha,alpha-trehalose-phosphate synthase (UDP-forming)/trehalose-phosphatase [Vicinamibacterales bacterium]
MSRLLIVSNRLPVTLALQGSNAFTLRASSGGLATAMRGVHADADSLWIGNVGDLGRLSREGRTALDEELGRRRLVSVPLTASEISLYYNGFSNAVLWPLFHYLLDKVRLDVANEWRAYKAVNQRFADAIVRHVEPGDTVWVHDYHLALVPGMVRPHVEDVRIGYFLHVPWPSSDVYRVLPHREEILQGLLAADVLGFQTEGYRHNFIESAAKVLGVGLGVDTVVWEDRTVRIGVYPIGVDVAHFARVDPKIDEAVARIRRATPGKTRLLGVDRLDYTKGVPRRLLAIDRLLNREPPLRDQVHFIQLAVPSREKVDEYADLRRTVNELVGRINSQYGSPTGSPVQLLYRSVDDDDLLSLYRSADVMVVTPLRDGMNLVAKEFVASRLDERGVLVLSEFAGAAAELDAAVTVNPLDLNGTASAIRRAMLMSPDEQGVRMRRLREAVLASPVDNWARSFLDDLTHVAPTPPSGVSPPTVLETLVDELAAARHRVLLLDYDGTLVPIERLPDLASPDPPLLTLLGALADTPGMEVHVVSGRSRDVLSRWLGALPVWMHAEHGFWTRTPNDTWSQRRDIPAFREPAIEIMRRYARATPGAMVEPKAASVAFHMRGADPRLASVRLDELRAELAASLGSDAELMDGHKVLEVRPAGVNKGRIVEDILSSRGTPPAVFAAGDDRTDEDMFAVLGPDALTLRVGPGTTRARFRVATPFDLRRLLQRLIAPSRPAGDRAVHA